MKTINTSKKFRARCHKCGQVQLNESAENCILGSLELFICKNCTKEFKNESTEK